MTRGGRGGMGEKGRRRRWARGDGDGDEGGEGISLEEQDGLGRVSPQHFCPQAKLSIRKNSSVGSQGMPVPLIVCTPLTVSGFVQ